MKIKALAIAAALTLCLLAADKIQPLNAKLGLWEITTTQQMRGAPPIPPEALAKMTPEQRAQIDSMLKQRAAQAQTPKITQTCLTQEKLDKAQFIEEKQSCRRAIVNSSSRMVEVHEDCSDQASQRTADVKYELVGDNNMKGSIAVKVSNAGRTMNMNIDLSGKWLGSDCGAVK